MENKTQSCRRLEYNMCNTNFGTANRAATSNILLMHGTCM